MKKIVFLTVLMVLLFFSSCSNDKGVNEGSLRLSIVTQEIVRTIVPAIDMEIDSFRIYGTGPGGEEFDIDTEETEETVSGLKFGAWTVYVEAKNAEDKVIANGSNTTTVQTGETAEVTVNVRPLSGTGTLSLTASWNGDNVQTPSIEAKLISPSETEKDLVFTVDTDTASFSDTEIDTGYHTLIVKLLDNGILTMGYVDVVRIVKDEITSGHINFEEINEQGGNILVNIDADMEEPLGVEITGAQEEITAIGSMTVSASVDGDVGTVIYVWYINGVSEHTGETYLIEGLDPGVYNLTVTAFTTDGKRGDSDTRRFRVVE
jgi:hypothetical protein